MSLILLFTSIIFSVAGQLLIKHGMNKSGKLYLTKEPLVSIKKIITNKFVVLGFMSYGISAIVWLIVLNKMPLSLAYPLVSSSYILIAIFSTLFFKEKIPSLRWLSMAIIIIGIILLSNS
ncbi:EamA family transporter [Candidatus Woesearchaeota archaeon]|nr:EamA family transporter [Candidatus Woesearchaeota archaeon]